MQEFDTAVAAAERGAEEAVYEFVVNEWDGEGPDRKLLKKVGCRAFEPADGQYVVLMADAMGKRATGPEKTAAMINFLTDILDEESKDYIVGRLLDRNDSYGAKEVTEILHWLIKEWSGRPTKLPSDFAPSQKSGGQRSTRRTSTSTSSDSDPIAS